MGRIQNQISDGVYYECTACGCVSGLVGYNEQWSCECPSPYAKLREENRRLRDCMKSCEDCDDGKLIRQAKIEVLREVEKAMESIRENFDCGNSNHDERWCQTCNAMNGAFDMHERVIKNMIKQLEAQG